MSRRPKKKMERPLLEKVEILDAGAEGKAVARVENKVIFVPYGVPGDIADVQVTVKRKSYLEGKIVHLHKPCAIRTRRKNRKILDNYLFTLLLPSRGGFIFPFGDGPLQCCFDFLIRDVLDPLVFVHPNPDDDTTLERFLQANAPARQRRARQSRL